MRISEDLKNGVWQFRSSTKEEAKQLEEIARVIPLGGVIKYDGRNDDTSLAHETDELFVLVYLKYEVDGEQRRMVLQGTTVEDKYIVNGIRNCLFFGSPKLVLVKIGSEEDPVLIFATAACKICGKRIADRLECEWRVCDACANKCEHTYEIGLLVGGDAGLSAGRYCTKCGRANPGQYVERDIEKIEQIADVKIILRSRSDRSSEDK